MGYSITRNTLVLAGGGIFRQIMFFAATSIFAQKMQPNEFGIATLWYSIALILIGLADWGIRFSGWTDIARKGPDSATVSAHLSVKLILSISVVGMLLGSMLLIRPAAASTTAALAVVSLLFFNQLTIEWIFRGISDFVSIFVMNVISGVTLISMAVLAKAGAGADVYLWSVLISNILAVLYGGTVLIRRGIRWRRSRISQLVDMIMSNRSLAVVSVVNRSYANYSIVVLGVFATPFVVSQFRPSHMLFMFVSTLSYYVVGAVYSMFAAGVVSQKSFTSLFVKLLLVAIVGLFVSVIGSTYLAEWIILSVFGPNYLDAIPMLKYMMWVLPLGFLGMFVREFAPALASGKTMLRISLSAMILGIICVVFLVDRGATAYLPFALGIAESVVIILGVTAISRAFVCSELGTHG